MPLSDVPIDVAPIDTIELDHLVNNEPLTISKLLKAASSYGLFFLDLQSEASLESIHADISEIYKISEEYFDQSYEQKLKDHREDQSELQDRGYKKGECDETLEMAYDELVEGDLELPSALSMEIDIFKRFSRQCNGICKTLLSSLSNALELPPEYRFERHHRKGQPSDSGLKLIYEPSVPGKADVRENKHTDSGTLTLLFYKQWGLSVYLPGEMKWAFTALKPGCVLVNVADSLQRMSGGKLHSPLHRVTQPYDGAGKRYYNSYFLRPDYATGGGWIENL